MNWSRHIIINLTFFLNLSTFLSAWIWSNETMNKNKDFSTVSSTDCCTIITRWNGGCNSSLLSSLPLVTIGRIYEKNHQNIGFIQKLVYSSLNFFFFYVYWNMDNKLWSNEMIVFGLLGQQQAFRRVAATDSSRQTPPVATVK